MFGLWVLVIDGKVQLGWTPEEETNGVQHFIS